MRLHKKELTDFIPYFGWIHSTEKIEYRMKERRKRFEDKKITPWKRWIGDTFDTTYNLGLIEWNLLLATGIVNEIYNISY